MRISDWSSDVCSSDLFSTLSVLVAALLTILASGIPLLLIVTLMALSFLFSMFAVYGTRAASVGTIGILIMVLSMRAMADPTLTIGTYLLYILAGCVWYMLLRSEEHTSELQSLMRISYAVFCLKKKNKN